MINVGTYGQPCPVCRQPLDIPLHMTVADNIGTVHIDQLYLRRHWLTHDQHDGEPLEFAA